MTRIDNSAAHHGGTHGEARNHRQKDHVTQPQAHRLSNDDLRCLTVAETCALLGVSPDVLRDMDDPPPFIWLSKNRKGYPRYMLQRWQESRTPLAQRKALQLEQARTTRLSKLIATKAARVTAEQES